MASRAGAVWERRTVLGILVRRDLKTKYESTVLGYAWSLLEPLLLTGLYWVVFTQILDVSSRLAGAINADSPSDYGLFLIAGILPWLWFNSSVQEGTKTLMGQSKLITTTNLPREMFALEKVGSKCVEFFASVLVLPLFALIAWQPPHLEMLPGVLYAIVLQTVLLAGVTLILGSVTVLLRDVQRVMRVVLRACFYLSPVLYSATTVQERLGRFYELYQLNPLATIFQLHRSLWFPGTAPDFNQMAITTAISLAVLGFGWWLFHRLEPAVLKEL